MQWILWILSTKEPCNEIIRSARADMTDFYNERASDGIDRRVCPVLKALHTIPDNQNDSCKALIVLFVLYTLQAYACFSSNCPFFIPSEDLFYPQNPYMWYIDIFATHVIRLSLICFIAFCFCFRLILIYCLTVWGRTCFKYIQSLESDLSNWT